MKSGYCSRSATYLEQVKLLGVAVFAAVAIVMSGCGAGRATTSPRSGLTASVAEHIASSSRLVLDGHVWVTVAIETPVQVGHALDATFRFENVSRQSRRIQLGYGNLWLVVRGADGTKYDTRVPLRDVIWPYIQPITLRPGETVTRSSSDV